MELDTYLVTLKMAGCIESAKRYLREEIYKNGKLCVTIDPTYFIYVGGEESGFVIGFSNYPKFPELQSDLFNRARRIASELIPILNQKTALLIATDKTEWINIEPPKQRG